MVDVSFPGAQGRLLAGDHGQAVLWSFPYGGSVPAHRHGPQLGVILAGSMTLMVDATARHVVAGDYFEIAEHAEHSAVIAPGSMIIEVYADPDLHTARPQ
jgi:quercetin dioxygenase-like cupin family protein